MERAAHSAAGLGRGKTDISIAPSSSAAVAAAVAADDGCAGDRAVDTSEYKCCHTVVTRRDGAPCCRVGSGRSTNGGQMRRCQERREKQTALPSRSRRAMCLVKFGLS